MLSEEVKRRAVTEARRLKVSFADFVRQAIAEKLPRSAKGSRLKQRRQDPLFRLLDGLPLVKGAPTDTVARHDDYLYADKSELGRR